MTRPVFFDSVVHPDHTLGQWVENYFYLDGISNHFGYRKYTVISENTIERAKEKEVVTYSGLFFTTLKILSYICSVGLIPLTLLAVKGINRKINAFKLLEKEEKIQTLAAESLVQVPPPSPEVVKAEEYIKKAMAQYSKPRKTDPADFEHHFFKLSLDLQCADGHGIFPDWGKGSLVQFFKDDSKVFFVPDSGNGEEASTNPSYPEGLKTIVEGLQAGFTAGKEMVIIRIGDNNHSVAAGFYKDGTFKIIDSLSTYKTVNISKFTDQLNKAQIKDSNGTPIIFKGKYINTGIQQGTYDCLRFSTLYCYHMAKARSLNAYKIVNGAFKEGRFKKFEDYNNIEGVKPIKCISEKLNYRPFMLSWTYRAQGISVDDWRDVPFPVLLKAMPRRGWFEKKDYNLDFFSFASSSIVPRYKASKCSQEKPLKIELEDKQTVLITDPTMPLPFKQIPLPNDFESLTLRNFIPTNPLEKTILFFANGDLTKPRLYRLKKNQLINNSTLE